MPLVRILAGLTIFGFVALQVWLSVVSVKRRERISKLKRQLALAKEEKEEAVNQCNFKSDVAVAQRDQTIAQLRSQREVRQLPARGLIHSYLEQLALKELTFGEQSTRFERLTVYLYDEQNQCFHVVCRYSNSAELSTVPRENYPTNEGCLGQVWKQGFHCDCNYPHPIDNPRNYMDYSIRNGMPEERLRAIRMKARVYCGTVIWNKENTKHIGVLLLEASYDRYQTSFLESFMKKQARGHLGDLIDLLE